MTKGLSQSLSRDMATGRIAVSAGVLFVKSECPKRHSRTIDESKSPTAWIDERDKIIKALGTGFLYALVGRRGPGKTQMAQQAILWSVGNERPALYTRAMSIFLELRATFGDEHDSELAVIQKHRQPRLLVIDEMQERGETPWEDRMLNHLIDLRYGDMTDTLLIANLKPKALMGSLGESIGDRLGETGGIIECKWPSFRDKAVAV